MSAPPPLATSTIQKGLCYAVFAYDAARSIDLAAAEQRTHEESERPTIGHKRRTPSYFDYQPPPLRLSQDTQPIVFGRFATRTGADLTIYDFGAVSVVYTVPIEGPFEDLLSLSEELYDNESLLADSRLRVEELLDRIGDAA